MGARQSHYSWSLECQCGPAFEAFEKSRESSCISGPDPNWTRWINTRPPARGPSVLRISGRSIFHCLRPTEFQIPNRVGSSCWFVFQPTLPPAAINSMREEREMEIFSGKITIQFHINVHDSEHHFLCKASRSL